MNVTKRRFLKTSSSIEHLIRSMYYAHFEYNFEFAELFKFKADTRSWVIPQDKTGCVARLQGSLPPPTMEKHLPLSKDEIEKIVAVGNSFNHWECCNRETLFLMTSPPPTPTKQDSSFQR